MANDFAINADLVELTRDDKQPAIVLGWGDRVKLLGQDAKTSHVEVTDWVEQPDGSVLPGQVQGAIKRKAGAREVAVPFDQLKLLKIAFVDVQQGDGAVIETPDGKVITIDGGEEQLFARFLASRYRDTSDAKRLEIEAMIVTHGDADHFAGLTKIHDSETHKTPHKRLFIHPKRVYHNGLVKRPTKGHTETQLLGATVKAGKETVITGLETDLLAVPPAELNEPFTDWRDALAAWRKAGPIEFRRLAAGVKDAFDFLAPEHISVEVLGPIETPVGGKPGLPFLRGPKDSGPMPHLTFEPGALSASHTINGNSIVLRLTFGNYRLLFAGDLNNASEKTLAGGGQDTLAAEVFKVPHHGSHEFDRDFLKAVSPLISIVSSGDESARKEFIHPRATLMNALGRYSRDDSGLIFVTEMVAFFQTVGNAVPVAAPAAGPPQTFFGFRRSAFGCVRVRTDGRRLLVFTDSGRRDMKEAYAFDAAQPGKPTAVEVLKA